MTVLTASGSAALAAGPAISASGLDSGVARIGAAASLAAAATAAPDLGGLWAVYQQAVLAAGRARDNWRMMRQAGGADGSAGFLYGRAYEAERAADEAYEAFLAAQRRVFDGASG